MLVCKRPNYFLAQWFNRWLLSVNVQKSAVVSFRSTRMKAFDFSVSLDGMSFPQVSAHKHLGVTFSDTLTWENHIDAILSKGAQRIGLLRRYRKRLPSLAIRHFYCTSICPALEYASVAWSGLSSTCAARLERLQRRAARLITGTGPRDHLDHDLLLARAGLTSLSSRRQVELAVFAWKKVCLSEPA